MDRAIFSRLEKQSESKIKLIEQYFLENNKQIEKKVLWI